MLLLSVYYIQKVSNNIDKNTEPRCHTIETFASAITAFIHNITALTAQL